MSKKRWITVLVVLAVIILSVIIMSRSHPEPEVEVAKCIGAKAVLYTQLGCHACESQEKMFGDNYQYLSVVDCFFEREECIEKEIKGTPTWIINGEEQLGSRSIEELRELTGC